MHGLFCLNAEVEQPCVTPLIKGFPGGAQRSRLPQAAQEQQEQRQPQEPQQQPLQPTLQQQLFQQRQQQAMPPGPFHQDAQQPWMLQQGMHGPFEQPAAQQPQQQQDAGGKSATARQLPDGGAGQAEPAPLGGQQEGGNGRGGAPKQFTAVNTLQPLQPEGHNPFLNGKLGFTAAGPFGDQPLDGGAADGSSMLPVRVVHHHRTDSLAAVAPGSPTEPSIQESPFVASSAQQVGVLCSRRLCRDAAERDGLNARAAVSLRSQHSQLAEYLVAHLPVQAAPPAPPAASPTMQMLLDGEQRASQGAGKLLLWLCFSSMESPHAVAVCCCIMNACLTAVLLTLRHVWFFVPAAGAAACWANKALLQTVHELLLPPSSNLQLVQWSRQPELLQVSRGVRGSRGQCGVFSALTACRSQELQYLIVLCTAPRGCRRSSWCV